MLLPLGTDRPSLRPVLITPVLIGLNLVVFAWQYIAQRAVADPSDYERLIRTWMLQPHAFRWFQPLTSAFLHAGVWHIVGNMIFLWVFGPSIEDRLGRWWFLLFYVCGAYAAAGLHMALEHAPALGASGAIAALTGSYLVLFPRTHVKVLFLLWFGVSWVSAWWFIGLGIAWDLIGQASGSTGIAHGAHLGGVGFGMAVSFTLLGLRLLPREPFDLFTSIVQAKRRRELREMSVAQQRRVEHHWKKARGSGSATPPGAAPVPDSDVAQRRGRISDLLSRDQLAEAAAEYKLLVEAHAASPGATTLAYRSQEKLSTHFYSTGDHEAAAYAIDRLIESYPREAETPRFRLLLGLIHARRLNDPVRAKALLRSALEGLREPSERAMAERALEDLG